MARRYCYRIIHTRARISCLCHIADTYATRTDSHLLLTRHIRDGISARLDGCAIQFLFLGRPANKHLVLATNRLVGASCKC